MYVPGDWPRRNRSEGVELRNRCTSESDRYLFELDDSNVLLAVQCQLAFICLHLLVAFVAFARAVLYGRNVSERAKAGVNLLQAQRQVTANTRFEFNLNLQVRLQRQF